MSMSDNHHVSYYYEAYFGSYSVKWKLYNPRDCPCFTI